MKSKKILAAIITGIMTMSVLGSGFALKTSTAKAKVNSPITFTMFVGEPGKAADPDNAINKIIQQKTGVTIKYEYLVGDLKTKIGVMTASGDYPDLINGRTENNTLLTAGALIPLEDLITKYAPNLRSVMGTHFNSYKYTDGHIWTLPLGAMKRQKQVTQNWLAGFQIQKAVLKEFHYPKIKTLDQYFDLIAKYVKKYPKIDGKPTIGFTVLNDQWHNFVMKVAPFYLAGYPNDGAVKVDPRIGTSTTYTASLYQDTDIAKKYYKKLNDINAQGLFDKTSLVSNYDQYLASLSSGRVLGMFDHLWQFNQANQSLETQGKYDRTFVGIPLTYDAKIKDQYIDPTLNVTPGQLQSTGFAITKSCKDPARVMQFINQLCDEDMQKLIWWGQKGVDYSVTSNGRMTMTAKQLANLNDQNWVLKNSGRADFGNSSIAPLDGTYADGNAFKPADQSENFALGLKPIDKELLEAYGAKTWADLFAKPMPVARPYFPANSVDLGASDSPANLVKNKLDDVGTKYIPQMILAAPNDFEKIWLQYVAAIKACDPKVYVDKVNEQIKWRMDHAK